MVSSHLSPLTSYFSLPLLLLKLPAVEVGVALRIAEAEEEVLHALGTFYLAAEFFVFKQ